MITRKVLLQINTTVNKGSTGRIAEQIGILAKDEGWDCYIVHGPRFVNPSQLKPIQTISLKDEKLAAIQTRLFDNHGLANAQSTKKIIDRIKTIDPTIIHLHNIHGYYINYRILFEYLAQANIPVVWTLHDCWSFTGHCYHFTLVECDRWKTGCYNCPQKGEYPASLFLDGSKRNFLLKKNLFTSIENLILVPVSNWLASLLSESFFKNISSIKCIQNGVDLDVFKPTFNLGIKSKYSINEDDFVAIACSNIWNKSKGLYDYIALSEILEANEKLVLVGVSDEIKKTLPNNIIGITRIEGQTELAELYSMADVMVNLTYQDTFPTVNLESLACGTPVITYRTGGSTESVDENTGIVVEQGDIYGLKQAILIMKNTNSKYNLDQCRSRAEKLYNKNDRFKEYLNLYNKLI